MKNLINRSIGLIAAVIVALVPLSVCAGSVSIDSPYEPSYISNSAFPLNLIDSDLKPCIGIVAGDRAVILTGNRFDVNSDHSLSITVDGPRLYVNGARFDNYDFIFSNGVWSSNGVTSNLSYGFLYIGSYTPDVYLSTSFFTDPTFTPSYSERVLTGIDLSFNENDFVQWIIDNDKVGELPSYIGLTKLRSFVSFYKSYGGSNTSFLGYISQWFAKMNIVNQSTENINILKKSIDKLYKEYLNSYMKTFYDNSANQVHHRRNIATHTDDTDLTLVTDDTNDTIDISILRDILRAIIQFQTTFADYMERLFAKIDNLDFVTTVVNDGGNTNPIDLSDLYNYDSDAFSDDLQNFETSIEEVQSVPMGYISTINQNGLMPENMLQDKNSLTVNIPTITGFTVGNNGGTYSTQTGSYVLSSTEYPWLDTVVQKIKRFASIILILGYLVHLRYRIPELIRGE